MNIRTKYLKNAACHLLGVLMSSLVITCMFFPHQSFAQQNANEGMREVSIGADAFKSGSPMPEWFHPDQQLLTAEKGERATMRLADSYFRVDPTPIVTVHRAIEVNEASALAQVGQYGIAFQPEYQRVELHRLRIYRNGEIIDRLGSVQVRFFHPERYAEQGIYTGTINAVLITQDLRPGDTLEVIYSLIGQNPVFAGNYMDAASWDGVEATLKRRVTLDLPPGRNVAYRMIGATSAATPVPQESQVAGRRLIRFEATNLPAVEQDMLVPPDIQTMRWIQFSEFRTWRDVGKWATNLFEVKDSAAFAMPETPAFASKADALMWALQFVQDNVRYLSISIGENSHRPYPPDEVMRRRYGDCKDKTLLLVTMLRRLGIQAEPVLASVQSRKGLTELLPGAWMFDHAIVRATVDGKTYFLDPTLQSQGGRLDRLAPSLPGAEVLVVRPNVAGLDTIPKRNLGDTVLNRRSERVEVGTMGAPVEMVVEFEYADELAESFRRTLAAMSPAQINKAYEGLLDRRYSQSQLVATPVFKDDRAANRIVVQARYRIPNFFEREKQGTRWSARYDAANMVDLLPIPSNAVRRSPLYFATYPWAGKYSFELMLPSDYDGRYRPERRALRTEAFQLDELLSFSGRNMKVELTFTFTNDRIAAQATPQYLTDLRTTNGYLHGTFYVADSDRRSTQPTLSTKELSRQRLEAVLKSTEASISVAKGSGDSSTIRCEHALAAAYLDQAVVARQDVELAVSQQPTASDPLRCRGTVRLIAGDFDGAARDLTRAVALGDTEADTYFQRGLAFFYANQWQKAADDFATLGNRTLDDRAKARAAVWRMLALRRLNRNDPQARLQTTAWPAPILGLLKNEITTDAVIDGLNSSERGTQLEDAMAEAYFYFYQNTLATNRPKSLAYLKRSVELGPLYNLVQVVARQELKRIDSAAH